MNPDGRVAFGAADPTRSSSTAAYKDEAARFYRAMLAPGTGQVRRIRDLTASEDGGLCYFVGDVFADTPDMVARPGLYRLAAQGEAVLIHDGAVGLPRLSPTADSLAYVVPSTAGDRLIVADPATGAATQGLAFAARIEELGWSPDGARLLVRVAGLGADQSGRDGGVMAQSSDGAGAPIVSPSESEDLWRRLWVIARDGRRQCISGARETIWEAAWCGCDAVVVVRSPDHSENSWYDSELALIDLIGGTTRTLHVPDDQIGLPACSADGGRIAFVEAVCSDRGLVCGDLLMIDRATGALRTIDTGGIDVSSLAFRHDGRIHYAGLRSMTTVVGDVDPASGARTELWCAEAETCGTWHPASIPLDGDRALLVGVGPTRPPEIAVATPGRLEPRLGTGDDARAVADEIESRPVRWHAADGTELEGLLLLPKPFTGPLPIVVDVHGGPVLAHRPRWIGHLRTAWLVRRGYGLFYPNPRGSCGRGRAFAAAVRGDMGGVDADDLIAGVDHLIAAGIADPDRIAVTGSSYGGYMAAWLVTQTDRFGAAIAISPITNWRSQHGTSQIGRFDALFLDDPALRDARSPVVQADRVTTPTLLLAGGLDRNTPAGQAQEFHTALLDRGVPTRLAIYPQGGHSLRDMAIMLDTSARTAEWLDHHLGQGGAIRAGPGAS